MTLKVSTKKNLRRNTENTFNNKFIFANINRMLTINTLIMGKLMADFISIQSAMNEGGNKVIAAYLLPLTTPLNEGGNKVSWQQQLILENKDG